MKKLNVIKTLGQLTMSAVLLAALQSAAVAQHDAGYYPSIPIKYPVDVRMSALYDRVIAMYNAGLLAPQERAELLRDLDGIQCYETRARIYNPYGMSKWAVQHLNRKLDMFSAQLEARGAAS